MFVLAHLSDPHLSPLPPLRAAHLLNKRALGFLNWKRKRGSIHRADVLEALVRDLKAQAFDHLAVTGDLVNLALEAEFAAARAWLERLGAPDKVTLVPGNHDIYVRETAQHAEQAWEAYARGDAREAFPFVRRRGQVALIGVSSALPTPLFMATGRIGAEQLARLESLLAMTGREGLFRAVLIHHPPFGGLSIYQKRLIDAAGLRAVLRRQGAELLIHGHHHLRSVQWLEGPRPIPAVGVPSASASPKGSDEPAAYHLFEIGGNAGAWRCTMIARGFSRAGEIGELERQKLAG
ncbi:MAG TPA: metallophosphoesterase [Xanthobacteraceae bacterium]|nr:metallophosphoesterase [Xanthobacteraceae bacterium]